MAEMRLMMEYLAQFDGKKKWEEVSPVAERLYHPELIVSTGKGELGVDDIQKVVQSLLDSGTSIEMLKLEQIPDGVRYELVFHRADGITDRSYTTSTFKDGRLYRVEPDNPDVYSDILLRD